MKKKYLASIAAAILCSLFNTASAAGVYKWTDQDGQVHYGDKPGNANASPVTIRKNETTTPRAISKQDEDAGEKQPATDNSETPAKEEKPAISRKEKQRLCNEAKSDIATISSHGRMREKNASGEYIYLSEAQRQQRLAAAKKKQHEFCR